MTHINDINNEVPTQEIKLEIGWFIDRTPDLNIINNINRNDINDINDITLLNNIQNIRNNHFDQQFALANQALINGVIQFDTHDFIPFEPQHIQYAVIETEVREINVSQEERDCPICFETRETAEISQLNCQHKFCTNCITEHIHRNRSETRCPFCRENITHITFQNNINEEHFQYI
jgi:hypothetical protein